MERALSNPYLLIGAGTLILCVAGIELIARLLNKRTLADRIAEFTSPTPSGTRKHTRSLLAWMQIIAAIPLGVFLLVTGFELLGN